MNKYLTEFIGTFFLVLTLACSVIGGAAAVLAFKFINPDDK